MSLTAHLLFNRETKLPDGVHRYEGEWATSPAEQAQIEESRRQVCAAIGAGHNTFDALLTTLRCSRSTLQRRIHDLEDSDRIQRTTRPGETAVFELIPPSPRG